MAPQLEIIGFTLDSCAKAQHAGADRIELCDNPADGGTTPSFGFIKTARKILNIDLFPMIRPRGGDFLYSDTEFESMKDDIKMCKDLGCDGVVFGMLLPDGTVDKARCTQLVEVAYPLETTFHRAFDRVNDAAKALEDVIDCGFTRILSSGLHKTAIEGKLILKELIQQATDRIIIMPGSGVRSDSIIEIQQATGAIEFHSSAKKNSASNMHYSNILMNENFTTITVDEEEIKNMIIALKANHS